MQKKSKQMLCFLLLGAMMIGAVACNSDVQNSEQQGTNTHTESQSDLPTTEQTTQDLSTEEEIDVKDPREIGERYFIYRIWNFTPQTQSQFEATVDAAEKDGFNAIKVHIPWSRVESVAGQYDYTPFDPMIEYVVKKGLKVAISVDLTRRADDKVIGLDQMQRDPAGNLCQGGSVDGMRTVISFCSESAVSSAVAFYEDTVRRYDQQYGDDVLFYLPAFTQYAESEYWPAGEYDYSDLAKASFSDFLQEKYLDIAAINYVLGSSYADFSEIEPPSCSASDNLGVLWYSFRHQKLKGFIDALAKAQKDIAPDSKLALQFGSHFDAASVYRCTLAAGDLAENVDIVWIDDGPNSDHEFSMDYAVATFPVHIQLAQEIDGPLQVGATPEKYLEQGMDAYSRGCTYLSIANWSIDDAYQSYKWVWEELSSVWLGENPPAVLDWTSPAGSMEIKLSELLRKGSPTAFMTEYHTLAVNGSFVDIKVTDDLSAAAVDQPQSIFAFPGGYSTEQGQNHWYYLCSQPKRDKFFEMTYDSDNGRWKGKSEYSLIMNGTVHPDAYDAVLAFKAPKDGTIQYRCNLSVASSQSDGIKYRVMQNETVLTEGDRYGYLDLPYGELGEQVIEIQVKQGDMIAVAVNIGNTSSHDSTALSVEIEYVE